MVLAGAEQVLDGDAVVVEHVGGEAVEAVASSAGVEAVGGEHGVEHGPGQGQGGVFEDDGVVLEVLSDLLDAGVIWKSGSCAMFISTVAAFSMLTWARFSTTS